MGCCGSADESKKRHRVEPKIDAETDLDDVLIQKIKK